MNDSINTQRTLFLSLVHPEACDCGEMAASVVEIYKPKEETSSSCVLNKTLHLCATCLTRLLSAQETKRLRHNGIDTNMLIPKIGERKLKFARS